MCPEPLRNPYPSDVSDEEWSLVVPYLTLMTEAAPQREHSLRELFNALRYVILYGVALSASSDSGCRPAPAAARVRPWRPGCAGSALARPVDGAAAGEGSSPS